jgi:hypothetical protein
MMELNNFMTPPQYLYWPQQPHRPSIFKLLWVNGLTNWKIYNSTQWQNHVFTYELFLEGQIPTVDTNFQAGLQNYIAPVTQFYADALAGNLPAFSLIEPVWIGSSGTTSYHPGADLVPGEVQLNQIYDSLRKGPGWDQTLFVITFDEHGGIFDHVPPPYGENPWPHDLNDGFHYDLMGPRVPTIVVSPWIEDRTVFRSETSVEYDGTSFMATLLQWCGIPRPRWFMGDRANRAPSFEALLTRKAPRKDSPSFKPPYDKNFPPSGPPTPNQPVHDLHVEIAHQIIARLTRGKLAPEDIAKLSDQITHDAKDVATLTRMLDEVEKRFR